MLPLLAADVLVRADGKGRVAVCPQKEMEGAREARPSSGWLEA